MSGGVLRQGSWLQTIRAKGAGIARLLLLAFALQLSVPLLDLGGVAAQAGEAALQADLQSSLCHDGGNGTAPDQAPASSAQVKHCIFCLPMAGDPAAAGIEPQAPEPSVTTTLTASPADDQAAALARPAFARSRAPPASPRTV